MDLNDRFFMCPSYVIRTLHESETVLEAHVTSVFNDSFTLVHLVIFLMRRIIVRYLAPFDLPHLFIADEGELTGASELISLI